jgi:protein involved in polysaccharide export with SLBB domain
MHTDRQHVPPAPNWGSARRLTAWLLLALSACAGGCASWTNPVADGVPVRRLSADFFPAPKAEFKTIPLTILRQPPPDVYRLDKGDVLGIYIEGVLGEKSQPPPVRYAELGNLPPAVGFPIPVDAEGNIALPIIAPLPVKGLTVIEVRDAIFKAYTQPKELINPQNARVLVALMRPRQYRVQVIRQDAGSGVGTVVAGIAANTRRGSGATLDLPAYENDVLTALSRTGGLPGLDAINEVIIERTVKAGAAAAEPGCPPGDLLAAAAANTQVVRIPMRVREGEPLTFREEDIILKDGDIVFIEARDTEVFYTGGLLLPRQFVLPRDYDLHVADAVALAGGPLINGGVTQNNLSGAIIASGLGSPSPSSVTVLRRTKLYGQVAIKVNLNRALRDPRENILIQPGDMIILQETLGESLTRYVTTVLRFNLLGFFANRRDFIGTANANLP